MVFYLAPASPSLFCYGFNDGVFYRDVLLTHLFDRPCGCFDPFGPSNLPLLPFGNVPPVVLYFFPRVFQLIGKKKAEYFLPFSPGVQHQLYFAEAEQLPHVFARQQVVVGSAVYFYTAGRFSKKSAG